MPNIYSIMDISRWSLQASTRQLDTVSHNVANANTPGYSRQEVVLSTQFAERTREGWYGHGVQVDTVVQKVDKLILRRITDKLTSVNQHETRMYQLMRLESLSNEASATSLGSSITSFFNAWQDLSNNVESTAVRETVADTALNLVDRFNSIYQDLELIERDMTSYIAHAVKEVNTICRNIADLNKRIKEGETSGHTANDLRDERINQLNDLASYMNIQWFEDANGSITVVAGNGKTLVQENYPTPRDADPLLFGLPADATDSKDQIMWQATQVTMDYKEVWGGQIGAWLTVRDQDIAQMKDYMNELSRTLIAEVNLLHSTGVGQEKFIETTGSYRIENPGLSFNSVDNNLEFKDLVSQGQVSMWVYDQGMRRNYTIDVNPNDSVNDIVRKFNQAMHPDYPVLDLTQNPIAGIDYDGNFYLSSSGGLEFAFESDTSGVLAALGVNCFFKGHSASTIALADQITENVDNIAGGRIMSNGDHPLGDNTNALQMADLKDAVTMPGYMTFNESIIAWSAALGAEISSTNDNRQFAQIACDELQNQRDIVSAVNMDEEMVKMIQFQRAYQAAAKMISTADTLLATLLEIKR